jgi:hypothetical protein
LVAVATAKFPFRAIAQNETAFAIVESMHLTDALGVDDRRAMDTREAFLLELAFHFGDGFALEPGFFADMKGYIVAGGFDPICKPTQSSRFMRQP